MSLSAITITCCAIVVAGLNKQSLNVRGAGLALWYHYDSISPTRTRHGSKEFWINCSDYSIVLEEPDYGKIKDGRDFSTLDDFYNLDSNDVRFVQVESEPVIENDTVLFGVYPQNVVHDQDLITHLNNEAVHYQDDNFLIETWYKYKGEFYEKIIGNCFHEGYCAFDNGDLIVNDEVYWFKCEPIAWKILKTEDNIYTLLSPTLLDMCQYYYSYDARIYGGKTIYANNYSHSLINGYLNGEFLDAITFLGACSPAGTIVDNSKETTDSPEQNPFAFDNHLTQVFLLSYQDYLNPTYGFETTDSYSSSRYCKTTEYVRVKGASYNCYDDWLMNNGAYWTRSPAYSGKDLSGIYASCVDDEGIMFYASVKSTDFAFQPALRLEISLN